MRHLGALLFAGVMLAFAGTQAAADCATAGTTVTCTSAGGTQTVPVGTGIEDGLTVNIQAGATVDVSATLDPAAVFLHDSNVVNNAGTIINGDSADGISVNNGNVITNSGSIRVGDNSAGIRACCNNTIINSGTITAGVGGSTFGIFAPISLP